MNANPSTAAVANRRGTHLAAGSSWATSVTWVAILAPLPYSLSRLLWAAGVPFGISPEGLRELDSPGWGSLPILLLALLSEATATSCTPSSSRAPGPSRAGFPCCAAGRSARGW